jgi:hypothetical protein
LRQRLLAIAVRDFKCRKCAVLHIRLPGCPVISLFSIFLGVGLLVAAALLLAAFLL